MLLTTRVNYIRIRYCTKLAHLLLNYLRSKVGLYHGVINKIWRRHFNIVDTSNCEAPFRDYCQPFFVLTGCLLLN